jgi:hypothetical protein
LHFPPLALWATSAASRLWHRTATSRTAAFSPFAKISLLNPQGNFSLSKAMESLLIHALRASAVAGDRCMCCWLTCTPVRSAPPISIPPLPTATPISLSLSLLAERRPAFTPSRARVRGRRAWPAIQSRSLATAKGLSTCSTPWQLHRTLQCSTEPPASNLLLAPRAAVPTHSAAPPTSCTIMPMVLSTSPMRATRESRSSQRRALRCASSTSHMIPTRWREKMSTMQAMQAWTANRTPRPVGHSFQRPSLSSAHNRTACWWSEMCIPASSVFSI